jgi:hypothetical protein
VVWNMNFIFSIYWELSSQLTFIFFRGVETINQLMDIKGIYRRICRLLLGGFLDQWRFIAGKTICKWWIHQIILRPTAETSSWLVLNHGT